MARTCCVLLPLLLHFSSSFINNLPKGDEKSLLLLVQDSRILLINANNLTERRVIIDHAKPAVAVDYFYNEGLIFFTEESSKDEREPAILATRFDNPTGKATMVISKDLKAPDGLAVDWIGKKLYWTDSKEKRIEVSDIDGKNRRVLFWENLDRPRAIVVDPLRGYLYWTDWGKKAKIERAGMDGSDRRTIVDKNLQWPNGLTIDYEQSRLYWVDGYMREIASCDLDGSNIKVHYKMGTETNIAKYGQHPFAMTVLRQNLYVSDWDMFGVFSIEKRNATVPKKILDPEYKYKSPVHDSRVMDIKGFDPSRQPHIRTGEEHPCMSGNGNCSHLCLLKPTKPYYACNCPTGIMFDSRTNNCPPLPENILILASKHSLYKISLDTNDFALQTVPVRSPTPVVVEFDPKDKMLYWSDSKARQVIQRARLDGSGQENVIEADIYTPDGLAIDWIARNLYWTETSSDKILMSRLDGSSMRTLVWKDLDEPRGIAVDPINGFLFWTDWGRSPKIERSLLDGSNRTTILSGEENNLVWPNGLGIDIKNKYLYFSDARLDLLERCNYDGSNRTVVANVEQFAPHVFGFSFLDKYLYWSDWQSLTVGRVSVRGHAIQVLLETSSPMGLKAINLRSSGLPAPGNPCSVNQGNCSHICFFFRVPRPHRKCACPYDYILNSDGRTCSKADSFLIYSMRNEFRRISTSLPRSDDPLDVLPLKKILKAGSIAFEHRSKRLFWIDQEKNEIFQALLNGSHAALVLDGSVGKPRCLAVDWVHRNLYYGYLNPRPRIEMVSIRSMVPNANKFVIVHKSLKEPTALAVDPIDGWLYWADNIGGQRYNKVKVERSFLDGSRRESLFSRSASITDLIVDSSRARRRLLWVEKDRIMASDLRGYNKTKLFSRNYWEIKGLDVDDQFIYFTEARSKSIYRLHIGEQRAVVLERLSQAATGLILYSPSRQPGECRCCGKGCHHFCLPRRHNYKDKLDKCGCASHYTLKDDKLTCQEPRSFLLALTAEGKIIRYVPDGAPRDVVLSFKTKDEIKHPRSFVVVPEDYHLTIVYIDSEKGKIISVQTKTDDLTETVSNHLLESNNRNLMRRNRIDSPKRNSRVKKQKVNSSNSHVLAPYELAYDPINRYIFWTDTRKHVINVTSLDGEPKGPVVQLGSRVPGSIAIDPLHGHIYWVSTNINGSDPKIERCELDGINHRVIVADRLGRPGNLLVYDKYLYWIDPKMTSLERWDKLSYERTTLLRGHESALSSPAGLVALNRYLYWYSNKVLWRIGAMEDADGDQHRLEDYGQVIDMVSIEDSTSYSSDTESSMTLKNLIKKANTYCPGLCQSLCIPKYDKDSLRGVDRFRCGCPFGYYLEEKRRCALRRKCPIGQMHCGNSKQCFKFSYRCDGTPDCKNRFDEENCPRCVEKNHFLCGDGKTCIPMSKRCDGHADCDTDEICCPNKPCRDDEKCVKRDPKCADDHNKDSLGTRVAKEQILDVDVSSRTTYTVAVVVAVLAVVLTCGIAGYTCTRRGRHAQDANAPYVMHTDQLDIMLVPNGPLFSQTPSIGDSDLRPSSHSRLGPSGSTGCQSSAPTPPVHPPSLPMSSKRHGGARTPQPDVISFYERDRLTGASRSDTDAPDYACPLNPPPSPITEVGTRGRARAKGRSRKRRHRSGGGGTGGRHHRRYHNVRLVIYTDAPPPTPRTCLSSAEEVGPGSNSPQSSRRSYNYNRPFPPPPSPENSSD